MTIEQILIVVFMYLVITGIIWVPILNFLWDRATLSWLDFRSPRLHWLAWQTFGVARFVITMCIMLIPPRPWRWSGAWHTWRACMRRAYRPKPPRGRMTVSNVREVDDDFDIWSPSRGEWIRGRENHTPRRR